MMMKIPRLPAGVALAGLDFNQGRLTQKTGSLLWVSSSPVVKSLVRDFPQRGFFFLKIDLLAEREDANSKKVGEN